MTKAKEPENTNLDLWNRLQTTPAAATKPFKGKGGFSGTAINGMYIIKRLTEEFGPVGHGWQFVIDDEQIVEGHTLKSGDKAKLHKIRGHIEYGPRRGNGAGEGFQYQTSSQFGQTMLVDENKYGPFTDEEAAKKSATDCLGKCASQLGIGADIFLGLYDDNKYVNQRKQEAAEEAKAAAPASEPQPEKLPATEAPKAAEPAGDDKTISRQVFHLVKGVAEGAKDPRDIDDILKHNAASLKVLERAYPDNYETLKGIVKTERERLAKLPRNDPAMNDDLPEFEDIGR